MLMPKRVKYRKAQRGRMKGIAVRGSSLALGDCGLKALGPGWVTNGWIEAGCGALTEEIFNLRFQLSMGMAKNPSRLSQAKKDLARANTVLREKKGASRG